MSCLEMTVKRVLLLLATGLLLLPTTPAQADELTTPPSGQAPAVPAPAEEPADEPVEQPETPVWAGYPGTNEAYDAYGYPWPAAPDCNEVSVDAGACVNDGLGFFQGQCTSWVAHRLGQRNALAFSNWYAGVRWGNATEWAKVSRSIGLKPNETPAVGSVGWYARGHVSYVEEVNPDGSIVVSEMNFDGRNGFRLATLTPGGPGWPDKFIHLADVVPVDYTAPDAPAELATTTVAGGVDVSWKASADDVGTVGYRVLRNDVPLATSSTPSYVDRLASPDQAYTYSVQAYDGAGNVSDASTTLVRPGATAPARLARPFLPGSARLVGLEDRDLVCGRLGTLRNQRVGCVLRTPNGPRLLRTGREVPWGSGASRALLAGADGRVWLCRTLTGQGGSQACLPFDPVTRSWGFDRIDTTRAALNDATWVAGPDGPARCGLLADRATCSVVTDAGWRPPQRARAARPGDPLSRAFVPTEGGIGFCRVVEGRAACTELGGGGGWQREVVRGQGVEHGRWVARRIGPALCPVGGGECRTVARP